MSSESSSTGLKDPIRELGFSEEEYDRLERAAEESRYGTVENLVREASFQYAGDLLADDGFFDCTVDGCDESFDSERQLRGHLGSDAHAVDNPNGDFWCGVCGDGPYSYSGVNSHHGAADSHNGDPIHLNHEPDEDDIVGVDELPDYKNPELLEELYDRYDQNIAEMCRQHDFDVTQGSVRRWLVEYGIHEVTPHQSSEGSKPAYRDKERLEELYEEHDGNLSTIAREMDDDVNYSNVRRWVKKFGIHDPNDADRSRGPDLEDDAPEPRTLSRRTTSAVRERGGFEDVDDVDDEDPGGVDISEVVVCDPAEADSFEDLDTPDWLVGTSFELALEMADTPEEFAEHLGWGEPEKLEAMAEVVGLEDELVGGQANE